MRKNSADGFRRTWTERVNRLINLSPTPEAVVLAGGKSSRMGSSKALLPFDNEPLIVHIVRALNRIFAETVVVAAPGQEMPR